MACEKNVLFIGVVIYLASLVPRDANQVSAFSDYLGYIFIVVFCALPLMIFLLVSIKRRFTSS